MAERSFKKINEFLDSVIRARLKVRRLEAGMVLLLGVLAVLLLAPAAVVSQISFGYSAIIYAGLAVLLLGAALIRCWWLATRRPRRERIALDIEQTHPDLGSNLISSLQLFPRKGELGDDDPTSPALIDALVNDTSRESGIARPGGLRLTRRFPAARTARRRSGHRRDAHGVHLAGALSARGLSSGERGGPHAPRASPIWRFGRSARRCFPGCPRPWKSGPGGVRRVTWSWRCAKAPKPRRSIAMEKAAPHHFRARLAGRGSRCAHHGAYGQVPLPDDRGSRGRPAEGWNPSKWVQFPA